jgi:hypothetical protein
MQQVTVLVLVAVWWSLSLASAAKATTKGNEEDAGDQMYVENVRDAQNYAQEAQLYVESAEEQMPLDYSQQPIFAPYQQPAYDPGQGYYQQLVQPIQQQPASGQRFLATVPYQQPSQGSAQGQVSNPVQGVAQSPVQVSNQVPLAASQSPVEVPAVAVPQSPAQVPTDVTVTIGPTDGSTDTAANTASHLQHETKFSLCDVLPPPWNIICMIFEFIFFTWPMYYFWLGLIALFILFRIYLAFKEVLDPIIIAILDAIYLVVWCIVTVCQAIWRGIKLVSYPIKESILKCKDGFDFCLNPWKQRRPHTHVPGFSY